LTVDAKDAVDIYLDPSPANVDMITDDTEEIYPSVPNTFIVDTKLDVVSKGIPC
jgi:hypothetical protein